MSKAVRLPIVRLPSARIITSISRASTASPNPPGAAIEVPPIVTPTSACRSSSVSSAITTAPATAPVRLRMPPMTSMAMSRKVRSR